MGSEEVTKRKISLFDTTLRDGQQTPGVSFSLEDKLAVMGLLDRLGVDYIEGGYPGGNPTDGTPGCQKLDYFWQHHLGNYLKYMKQQYGG